MTGAIQYKRNGLFDRLISNRLLLTWFATISLTGAYLVYAQALRHVIKEKVIRREFPKEAFTSPAYATGNNEKAKKFLPENSWAADARYQFQDENVYVYTEKWEQEEENKAARMKPFAMLMFDQKKGQTEQPFALMSQEALIRFELPFGVKHTDPGRMIAGSLEGEVKITGPNGLIIYGRNFFYDESSMNIWSDHEVRFAYENHQGIARGIEMKLIPAANKPKELKPAAEGIREIVLRRDVHMKLALKKNQKLAKGDPSQFATIKSTGSFTFNLETNQGSFTEDVRVYHPTSSHQADTLQCDQLNLQFVRKAEPKTNTDIPQTDPESSIRHTGGNLKFQQLVATGRNVTLISEENQFTGTMTRLSYNEETKTIVLSDEREVRVLQQSSELRCPEITILQNQEGQLETITCKGAGWMKHRDPKTGQLVIAAQWARQMKKSVDPKTKLEMVELEKQCIVRQPAEEFALAAQMIRLWLKGDLPTLKKMGPAKQGSEKSELSRSQKMQNKFDPHKMIAEQDVAIYSPKLRGKTKRLEVWFGPVAAPQSAPNAPVGIQRTPQPLVPTVKQVAFAVDDPILSLKGSKSTQTQTFALNQTGPFSNRQINTAPAGNSPTVDEKEGQAKVHPHKNSSTQSDKDPSHLSSEPVMVIADLMRLRVTKNSLGKAVVEEVWTEGHISVQQMHGQEKPLHITGNKLHIQNKGDNDQILHITGSPAKINERGFQIEGENIFLFQRENRAEVRGKGLLLLPVRGDKKLGGGLLSGAEEIPKDSNLIQPAQKNSNDQDNVLEIHWDQEMVFDGLTANFFGKVRTNMGDNRLRCQEMDVILSDRVSFSEKKTNKQKPAVHFITCRDGVEVESNEYLENRLIGIRRASFWQMNVDRKTGDAEARGPGWLVLWRRENPGQSRSQTKVSQANLPQKTDSDSWTYTRIDFNGKMSGNVSQRSTTFDDLVRIIYGGVKRPLDTIDRDKLPPGAGWMRSNSLKLIQHELNGKKKKFISMLAKGNAEVEGNTLIKNKNAPVNQPFSAQADTISFDESKDLYTFRSFGSRKATLRRFSEAGSTPTMNVSQQIEFSPAHDRVTLHGVTVIQGLP